MPRLWSETIEAHRHAVREAILETAWRLVCERGLPSVTMAQIASHAGIGRATLYKYFPDVEAILAAWHERHVTGHLEQLVALRNGAGDARGRLGAVLQAYAMIAYNRGQHGAELVSLLHRGEHVTQAQDRLRGLVKELLTEVKSAGDLRGDVAAEELAIYCLHALSAASALSSEAAVHRLVKLTLSGLGLRAAPEAAQHGSGLHVD